jgi:hypothetical protein
MNVLFKDKQTCGNQILGNGRAGSCLAGTFSEGYISASDLKRVKPYTMSALIDMHGLQIWYSCLANLVYFCLLIVNVCACAWTD